MPASFLDVLPTDVRARLLRRAQPDFISPMLATLTDRRFSDPNWIFERKLDGERCLAFKNGSRVRLMSRNRLVITSQYPEVAGALAGQSSTGFVIDGEVVAFDGEQTSFHQLQRRMHVSNPSPSLLRSVPVVYFVFDLVHAEGYDLTKVELRWRKELLRTLLRFQRPLDDSEHRVRDGEAFYREACADGWEGVIA